MLHNLYIASTHTHTHTLYIYVYMYTHLYTFYVYVSVCINSFIYLVPCGANAFVMVVKMIGEYPTGN